MEDLKRLARGTHEIAQYRHVGTIGANAPGIHRQAQALRLIEIDARIIQFGQTKTLRG